MKKIGFIIVLLCMVKLSKGQEPAAKNFYLYLEKTISSPDTNSITLTATEYGCFGSQINWSAKIKKIYNQLEISFYRQRPKNLTKPSSEYETVLDTMFMTEKAIFKNNLAAEIIEIQSRPILIEANFKISITQGNSNKEFLFIRGDGLYHILRHNKTWAMNFVKK